MATGTSFTSALEKIGREHLECSICQERYNRPKILHCLHSFCEKCLERYCSTTYMYQDATEIPCPVCRQETQLPETGVQGLKTNFALIGLVEEVALQEKVASSGNTKLLCEICEEEEALHRCLDCAQNICSNCHKMHLRITSTSSHAIATLKDICEGKVSVAKKLPKHHQKCPNHEGEVTRFFCKTCEELICRDCTVIDHCKPQHEYIDTNLAISTYKQSLTELFAPLEETLKELTESRASVSTMKRELNTTVDRTMVEVQSRAAEIRAEVTAQENRLIEDIKTLHKDRDKILNEYEKTMSMVSERIQHSLETAKYVSSSASDSDFLSLYPTFSKDLKSLASQDTPTIDKRLSFLKFQQSEGIGGINAIGRVVREGKWELYREFGESGSGVGEFNWALDVAALQSKELAVADHDNHRVVIYSIDGHHQSTIPENAWGIAATHIYSRLVVVDGDATHVKVLNKDNTLAFEFPTVPPSEVGKTAVNLQGVAVKKDGTIIVGDIKRMVLTEHAPNDGTLIRTIPVETKPFFLAVNSDGRVAISSWSPAVDVADSNGATLHTIKPTIDGKEVEYCRGVYFDSCSGIYIAMCKELNGTGHIHHYDAQGGFLRCIAQGLHDPCGITLTADDKLVVADFESVKIYHMVR